MTETSTFAQLMDLNNRDAIPGQLCITPGPGGIPQVVVNNSQSTAVISLLGAQVTHFTIHGQAPLLFLSDWAMYIPGKAIRGGIPICWPWFHKHPTDPTKPTHGFARSSLWQVDRAQANPDGSTLVEFTLTENETTTAVWPYRFEFRLGVTVGNSLDIVLTTTNRDRVPFTVTGALHTYFLLSNIDTASIHGLEGVDYLDHELPGNPRLTNDIPVTISALTTRFFIKEDCNARIVDPGLGREILISNHYSDGAMLWNPHLIASAPLNDIGPEEYRQFLCFEALRSPHAPVEVKPGETVSLGQTIGIA